MRRSLALGIDLGGTNIKWSVLDVADGWIQVDRGQVPTGAADGEDAVVRRLGDVALGAIDARPEIGSVGIGVPGLYDAATGVTRFLPNVPGDWSGRAVGAPVAERIDRPVALINDARAFGLAELRLGAARGAETMVGVTLGTGVGGVVAVGGRLHHGHDGTAGELGHQTIQPDGPLCGCGNRGCLEALACSDRITAECGTDSPAAAARAARAGDRTALAGLERVGRYLGIGLANLIVVLNPDRIVIGGGVAAAGDLLLSPIRAEVERRVHVTDLALVEIVTAELGTWAGAIGAGVHGFEHAAGRTPVGSPT